MHHDRALVYIAKPWKMDVKRNQEHYVAAQETYIVVVRRCLISRRGTASREPPKNG